VFELDISLCGWAEHKAQERKRLIEWRKREKAEIAAAKARAMEKVEEDRRARRIAAGLPPDLMPEELEAKRAKEQAARSLHLSRLPPHARLTPHPTGARHV